MTAKKQKIDELLTRGVEKVIVRAHLEAELKKDARLRLKLGIDPTGADLHIGHMVAIRKLRAFQALGHKVVIIVGDYTGRIGDPTGRDKMREPLTKEKIYENLKTYKKQIGKILDVEKTEFAYQSVWFDKKNIQDVIEWASIFTLQQMIDRDMFKRRMKEGNPIGLHEFLYPLMQGYDSVAIRADIEFGGSDQEFNVLVGRTMQEHFKQPPQDILTTALLLGTDGRKMSKTYNNYIGVMDAPSEMFGKVMSANDEVIGDYFTLCTDVPLAEIAEMDREMKKGALNPRDAKARLAREIVTIYHGSPEATAAEAEFEKIFKQKEKPSEMPVFRAKKPRYLITDLLVGTGLAPSKTEGRRLVEQKGVKIDDMVVDDDWKKEIAVRDGMVVQVGKRKFVKIVRKLTTRN